MTDQLEASLDMVAQGERIAGLAQEVAALKGALLSAQRPALDGVKGGMEDPARAAFVDRYVRQGHEAGVELKSFSGASGAAGGYAVPREIDQLIGSTLKGMSPIRAIANVVRTGSAGYRKLVTAGRRAVRQSGGIPGDAGRCAVRCRRLAGKRDCARIRGGRGRGLCERQWDEQAQGLPDLHDHQ